MKTTVEHELMSAKPGLQLSWRSSISGETSSLGVRYSVGLLDYNGARESTFLIPDAFFGCSLESNVSEVAEYSMHDFRGKRFDYSNAEQLCLCLPSGEPLSVRAKGYGSARYFHAVPEERAFEMVLGQPRFGRQIRPYFGLRKIDLGILRRIATLCEHSERRPAAYLDALTTVFLLELYRAFGGKSAPSGAPDLGKARFKQILDYIDDSLERDIGLQELATLAGLSVSQFAHAFRNEVGMAPYRYITQHRVARARTLLRTTSTPIATIAADLGYSSQSRFGEAFARIVGSTPSAYRAKAP